MKDSMVPSGVKETVRVHLLNRRNSGAHSLNRRDSSTQQRNGRKMRGQSCLKDSMVPSGAKETVGKIRHPRWCKVKGGGKAAIILENRADLSRGKIRHPRWCTGVERGRGPTARRIARVFNREDCLSVVSNNPTKVLGSECRRVSFNLLPFRPKKNTAILLKSHEIFFYYANARTALNLNLAIPTTYPGNTSDSQLMPFEGVRIVPYWRPQRCPRGRKERIMPPRRTQRRPRQRGTTTTLRCHPRKKRLMAMPRRLPQHRPRRKGITLNGRLTYHKLISRARGGQESARATYREAIKWLYIAKKSDNEDDRRTYTTTTTDCEVYQLCVSDSKIVRRRTIDLEIVLTRTSDDCEKLRWLIIGFSLRVKWTFRMCQCQNLVEIVTYWKDYARGSTANPPI